MNSRRAFDAFRYVYVRSGVRRVFPSSSKVALRGAWISLARRIGYPISSPRVQRPPLARGRRPFRLGRVLLACDLNRDYLDFWPSTRRAWEGIVGIEPTLVVVAAERDLPADLRDDPAVISFEPLEGIHSAFQAQCIRLLYPAILEAEDAIMIADIDLYPLRRGYFFDPIRRLDERFFVVYRDERLERGEVDIMFNAALPSTWGDVFGVRTLDDVRSELARWADGLEYDGRRGWAGWYTDQQMLYGRLMSWPLRNERLWVLDDQYCRYARLNRDKLADEAGLEEWRIDGMRRLEYSDFNCFVPYAEHREINDRVLDLGLEIARDQ